jgi:hypothetical protein
MRYRIVIEVDFDENVKRSKLNAMANEMSDLAITTFSTPVFLSTEQVMATEEVQVLRQRK